jgi:hypothetical protein
MSKKKKKEYTQRNFGLPMGPGNISLIFKQWYANLWYSNAARKTKDYKSKSSRPESIF